MKLVAFEKRKGKSGNVFCFLWCCSFAFSEVVLFEFGYRGRVPLGNGYIIYTNMVVVDSS